MWNFLRCQHQIPKQFWIWWIMPLRKDATTLALIFHLTIAQHVDILVESEKLAQDVEGMISRGFVEYLDIYLNLTGLHQESIKRCSNVLDMTIAIVTQLRNYKFIIFFAGVSRKHYLCNRNQKTQPQEPIRLRAWWGQVERDVR